jgi:hypothetical protein
MYLGSRGSGYLDLFIRGMPTSGRLRSGILRVVLPLRCEPYL